MAIEGPLRELGIHVVFQLLDLSRKTGALRVTSELRHNEGTIYFDNGVVVSAEIRSNPHPLGALLLRTGKITEADLAKPYPESVGGVSSTTGAFLAHFATHLAYHLGQVDYHRRILTGEAKTVKAMELKELGGKKA